ncbi:amino acid adenylation domain-containing protein, partial [Bacillus sp. NPDC077027]|uniref:amino acid adenylation domain-containing protein n=1 Tax=Bacillus sp. NPDC077027 TaxID=3390548 RepID=UPI003D02E301
MSKQKIQKVYPLTPMQEGMLYHAMLDPDSSSYFTQLELELSGYFDLELFKKSVNELIRTFDILRTAFVYQQLQKPRQVVLAERQADVYTEDLSDLNSEKKQEALNQYKEKVRKQGFHLAKDILFKVAVFQLDAKSWHVIWSNHHIIMDGWSMGVIMKKLFHYYESYRSGKTPDTSQGKPYADYIQWLGKQDKDEAKAYWCKRLEGVTQHNEWLLHQETNGRYDNREYTFTWNERVVDAIQELARRYQVTAPNVFQTIWSILLGRYQASNDVTFGTVVSGRPATISGIESMAGLFINTIPVRVKLDQNRTFSQLFTDMQQHALEAESYDFMPLYDIQQEATAGSPLFNHLVGFENYPLDQELSNDNMAGRLGFSIDVKGGFEQTSYDFNLLVYPGKTWTLKIKYNGIAFQEQMIERVAKHITKLMEQAIEHPEMRLLEGECVTAHEQEQIHQWNETGAVYPKHQSISDLLEERARNHPSHLALVEGERTLTYEELSAEINHIASYLVRLGVKREDAVAVYMERSADAVIAILAILKAGGAYVPIDPAQPKERVQYMLEDSGASLLLHDGEQPPLFEGVKAIDVRLVPDHVSSTPINVTVSPSDLAYIMYTSGSTGKPKGVLIEHRHIMRLALSQEKIGLNKSDRMAHTGAISFDAITYEIFTALLNGATLYPVNRDILLDINRLEQLIQKHELTAMFLTTGLFNQLGLQRPDMFTPLRKLMTGGDVMNPKSAELVKKAHPELILLNAYGPTENTTISTIHELEGEVSSSIPIGRPINHSTVYILDEHKRLQPIGAPGELYVGGDGVARGYLNRSDLTNEVFIADPFKQGGRLYRTGDLARYLADGQIEFLGRADDQIKIRGFRIELGEIEATLQQMDRIQETVVLASVTESGDQEIVAYYTGDVTEDGVKAALTATLPSYMVPHHVMQLEAFPLTTNGKIDRKSLPKPEAKLTAQQEKIAPETDTEKALFSIWKDILGKEVCVEDHFFTVGGHSLKAMMMTAKVQEVLKQEVSIQAVFEHPTIRSLASYLDQGSQGSIQPQFERIEPAKRAEVYPVSPAQRRLYILHQLEPNSTNYNIPIVMTLEGALDVQRLEVAFQKLIHCHEILRTTFHMKEGEVVQKVHKAGSFHLPLIEAKEEDAEIIAGFTKPFDLGTAPLLRAQLINIRDAEHLLVIDAHHIITDGSSMRIFIQDLAKAYEGLVLEERKKHYKDYAVWQSKEKETQRQKEHEAYWLKQFEGELPVLDLPTDYPRSAERDFSGERVMFGCDQKTTQQIHELLKQTDTTMYMFLLSAFQVLLATYSGQEDIIVGSPVAGRTHPDLQDMPGMFVNTIAMRAKPLHAKSFSQFLEEVKQTSLDAFTHQSYPLEELIARLPLDRDTSRSPLFSVSFNMQNMEVQTLRLGELTILPYAVQHRAVKFDLSLEAFEREGELKLSFDYATSLFKEETIRRFSAHFLAVVKEAIKQPNRPIGAFELIDSQEQRHRLGKDRTQKERVNEPFHTLFSHQARQAPNTVAVSDGERKLTYRELDDMSNALSSELITRGLEKEAVVALILDRSVNLAVSMLAVMKAGGVFLPIDPEFPIERIRYSLEDSGAQFVLTEKAYIDSYKNMSISHVLEIEEAILQASSSHRPAVSVDQLAYLIYTSGTTGKPKGVQLTHRNLVHYVSWFTREVSLQDFDRTALLSSYAYDLGYTSLFPVLKAGGTLYIPKQDVYTDPIRLAQYIDEQELTYVKMTPSLFHMMADTNAYDFSSLRLVVLGGEPIIPEDVEIFYQHHPCVAVMNHYGPTETAIGTVAKLIDPCDMAGFKKRSVIGQPIEGARALVLNGQQRLVPHGAPGELYISGEGLSRGYHNQPELTQERFLQNPYILGERMYRTGDVVRQHPNGDIEFLGRTDDQVKIRGYRIEKKEIEHVARTSGLVQDVYVKVVHTSRLPELALYYTSTDHVETLLFRQVLSAKLPEYMIPTYFVKVDEMLLTPNGKVDDQALPLPHEAHKEINEYTPPETELEQALVDIWTETLGVQSIGINDHFFELGGHSLKGMLLISKIESNLKKHVPLKVLFEQPTIRKLATYLEAADPKNVMDIQPAKKQDFYPVSSAQKRMYVLHQLHPEGVTYHMPAVLMMEGALDVEQLERALHLLVERHESLRTSFVEVDGIPVQKVHRKADLSLEVVEIEEAEAETVFQTFVRPFQLQHAPLMRAKVAKLSGERHIFMMDMHHIIADGVTRNLLIQELADLYRGKSLPPVSLHYKDFAVWQQGDKQQHMIEQEKLYWLEQYREPVQELALPLDFPRPAVQQFAGDHVDVTLSADMTKKIEAFLRAQGVSLNMMMQTTFAILLHKLTGQTDIVIGAVTAGRGHAAVERIPGMFVNTLALRNQVNPARAFEDMLTHIKEVNLAAYEHQNYPFEDLVTQLDIPKDTSRNPLFSVMLTTDDPDRSLPELEGFQLHQTDQSTSGAKFDLTLGVFEKDGQIGLRFEYATSLFNKSTIQRWSHYFSQLISQALVQPNKPVEQLSLLTEEEKQMLLTEWNGPVLDVPTTETVHALFEQQVARVPFGKAVSFNGISWSYEELNAKANQIANQLLT